MKKNNSDIFKYDFAISFAGENKAIAEGICNSIKGKSEEFSIFFAPNEKHQFIGKDGESFFEGLFSKSKQVIVLISKYYKKKKWTRFEWDVILKRSEENRFIPIKLDDTEIIGLPSNIIFEPYNDNSIEIAELCINKLLQFKKEKIISIDAETPTNYEHLPIIEDKSTKTQTFKPLKEEIDLLLLYKGDNKLFEKELLELSPFSPDKTKLYFTKLCSNDFIKVFSETETQYEWINMVGDYRYALTQKGREYLHENNILD